MNKMIKNRDKLFEKKKKKKGLCSDVHAMEDELGDETSILFLGIAEERQGTIVEFHDDLAPVAGHQNLQGAQVQSAELVGHGVDPAAVLVRHRRLFQHCRTHVRLPVARYRFTPKSVFLIINFYLLVFFY